MPATVCIGSNGAEVRISLAPAAQSKTLGENAMPDSVKYLLPEDRIPRAWYNIAADLPQPPPPPLHPGTGQPIGPDDLSAIFPMALIAAGGFGRARNRDPGTGARHLQALAAVAALSRPPARAAPRYARPHLLQIRGRQPARQPQAEHRGARKPSTTARPASGSSRPRPAPGNGAPRSPSPGNCSASRSRSTWSRSAISRSPTGGR